MSEDLLFNDTFDNFTFSSSCRFLTAKQNCDSGDSKRISLDVNRAIRKENATSIENRKENISFNDSVFLSESFSDSGGFFNAKDECNSNLKRISCEINKSDRSESVTTSERLNEISLDDSAFLAESLSLSSVNSNRNKSGGGTDSENLFSLSGNVSEISESVTHSDCNNKENESPKIFTNSKCLTSVDLSLNSGSLNLKKSEDHIAKPSESVKSVTHSNCNNTENESSKIFNNPKCLAPVDLGLHSGGLNLKKSEDDIAKPKETEDLHTNKQLTLDVDIHKKVKSIAVSSQFNSTNNIQTKLSTSKSCTQLSQCNLSSWGLPAMILQKYESRNIKTMFPWQIECLSNERVLGSCRNLVYSAPTSAGKTLVAEILAIKTVLERKKKVLFILPFVSVVREKMFYFQDILSSSGVRVEGFMGSYNPPGGFHKVQVAICTIEKANSLVNRLMEEGAISDLGAVIVDEMHLLGDPSRGYLLELLLTKLRYMSLKDGENVNIQIVGMSATLPNLDLLAKWLDAELYLTTFRPVPLYEQCHVHGEIYDNKLRLERTLQALPDIERDTDNILQLCLETIQNSCSVLIFCPTKNWCENLAQQIAAAFWKLGTSKSTFGKVLRRQLHSELISELLEQLKRCPVGLDKVLGKTASFGVAYHHAGLTMDERDIIEGAFRSNVLRVLVATSTLSSGVNLPARRVIIRSPMFHGKPMDTLTYRQMIGRAGRMGRDVAGESILVCQKNDYKIAKELMSAHLNPIKSCLEGAGKLKRAILEVIASGVASGPDDVKLFTSCTLLAVGDDDNLLNNPIDEALRFLEDNEFIRLQNLEDGTSKYVATSLAKACLTSSLPPEEGIALFTELEKARQCFVLENELHLIYLVTPYSSCHQWSSIDWMFYLQMWEKLSVSMKRVGELVGVREAFIVGATRGKIQTNTNQAYHRLQIHKRFYTALALQELVNEVPLAQVATKFNCARGMLQSLQQSAATFAGMVTSFSKQLGWSSIEILVSQFQDRLHFGVNRDLLDLMRLPLLNGPRARTLYNNGLQNLVQLASAEPGSVESVLRKVMPFESEKEREGETEYEARQRNKLRTVWITGKRGLTEREAAEMLIKDARQYLKLEMGLSEAKWEGHAKASGDENSSCENSVDIGNKSLSQSPSVEAPKSVEDEAAEKDTERFEEESHKKKDGESIVDPMRTGTILDNAREIYDTSLSALKKETEYETADCSASLHVKITKTSCNKDDNDKHMDKINSNKELNSLQIRSNQLLQDQESLSSDVSVSSSPLSVNSNGTPNNSKDATDGKNESLKINWSDESLFGESFESTCRKTAAKTDHNSKEKDGSLNCESVSFLENAFKSSFNLDGTPTSAPISNTSSDCVASSQNEMDSMMYSPHKSLTLSKTKILNRKRCRSFEKFVENSSPAELLLIDQTPTKKQKLLKNNKTKVKVLCNEFRLIEKTPPKKRKSDGVSPDERLIDQTPPRNQKLLKVPPDEQKRSLPEKQKLLDKDEPKATPEELRLIEQTPPKDRNKSKRKSKRSVAQSNATFVITQDRLDQNAIARKPQQKSSADLTKIGIINVCDNPELFNCFLKELQYQEEISVSLTCTKTTEIKSSIGDHIIKRNSAHVPAGNQNRDFVHHSRQVRGVSVAWGGNIAYYVNLHSPNVAAAEILNCLRNVFNKTSLKVKMFDCKEQIKALKLCCDVDFDCSPEDPKIGDWLLDPEGKEKNLQAMALKYSPEALSLSQLAGSCRGVGSVGLDLYSSVDPRIRSSVEAVVTWYLVHSVQEVLSGQDVKLLHTYCIEMNTVLILAKMELVGIAVDPQKLNNLCETLNEQTLAIEKRAYELAGRHFSFTSPTEVARILGMYKGKKVSTSKQILGNSEHPIATLILQWRKLNCSLTKMVYPLLRMVRNNRIHGCCITHNSTGRISMHEPNLQNVARDYDILNPLCDGPVVISCRSAFACPKASVLLSADYCQLELRLLAHFSGDALLCSIMKTDEDVFKSIAAKLNDVQQFEVTDELRRRAKQICYGIIYGMGLKSLSEQIGASEEDASQFLENFHGKYTGISKFIQETVMQCKEVGYVETVAGRRRYLPHINHKHASVRSQAERQAVNTKIQGSAADIAKNAMVLIESRLQEKFRASKNKPQLVLHLHDELLYEVPAKYFRVTAKIVKTSMEESVRLSIPFPVKLKTGCSWGVLKETSL